MFAGQGGLNCFREHLAILHFEVIVPAIDLIWQEARQSQAAKSMNSHWQQRY